MKAEFNQYIVAGLISKKEAYHPTAGYDLVLHEAEGDAALFTLRRLDSFTASGDNWSYVKSNTSLYDKRWHHIAATYDGTKMRMYIDGAIENEVDNLDGYGDNNSPLLIGNWLYGYGDGYGNHPRILNGIMDDVRIFNRVLAFSEIQTLAINIPLDLDNDGVLNSDDNCPDVGNPLQYDRDGDSIGLMCDPLGPDEDDDGVEDDLDNCRTDPNPLQYDLDHDTIGLVCDAETIANQALVDRNLRLEAQRMATRDLYKRLEVSEMIIRARYKTYEEAAVENL